MKSFSFSDCHIGISEQDIPVMLKKIGVKSVDELIEKTIPSEIRLKERLPLKPAMSEHEFAEHINRMAAKNTRFKSYIGQGWYDTATPAVIQRNVFENPVWYTYLRLLSTSRLQCATLRLCRLPTALCWTRLLPLPKLPL